MYLNASSLSGIFLLKSETIGLLRFHLYATPSLEASCGTRIELLYLHMFGAAVLNPHVHATRCRTCAGAGRGQKGGGMWVPCVMTQAQGMNKAN